MLIGKKNFIIELWLCSAQISNLKIIILIWSMLFLLISSPKLSQAQEKSTWSAQCHSLLQYVESIVVNLLINNSGVLCSLKGFTTFRSVCLVTSISRHQFPHLSNVYNLYFTFSQHFKLFYVNYLCIIHKSLWVMSGKSLHHKK